jgi:hypothetical protein
MESKLNRKLLQYRMLVLRSMVFVVLVAVAATGLYLDSSLFPAKPTSALSLIDDNLVVRYFVDEADSGTDPTEVLDGSGVGDPFNLTINYGSGNMSYTEVNGNRGLESTSVTGTQRADKFIDDTSDKVRDNILGATKATMEVVGRFDAFNSSGSRIFGIRVDGTPTSDNFMLRPSPSDGYGVQLNGSTRRRYDLGTGRMVIHIVVDTTEENEADRIKLYKNGALQTPTETPATVTQNATISTASGQILSILNCKDQNEEYHRPYEGVFFYGALYSDALTQEEVNNNYTILNVNDDTPSPDTQLIAATATIQEWLSFDVEPNTMNLGDLVDTGGNTFIGTATSTLTLGTNNENGWFVDIRSSNAALVHSSGTSTGQILSATSTVAAGEDHYGAQCASRDATCSTPYNKTANDVKGLADTDELFASTSAPGSLEEVILTVKAASTITNTPGTYSDTITLTALPGV